MSQTSSDNKLSRYEQGEKYMELLTQRSLKLSIDTRKNLNTLPKVYAKADELNRKLASSRLCSLDGGDIKSTPPIIDDFSDDVSLNEGRSNDKCSMSLKEHKKALVKRTMVISQCLDEDVRLRLENLKYGTSMSSMDKYSGASDQDTSDRRFSILDSEFNGENYDEDVILSRGGGYESVDDEDLFVSSSELKDYATGRMTKSKLGDFVLHLSADGQHALLRELEDSLMNEIELNRPDLIDKLPAKYFHSKRTLFNDESSEKRLILKQIETVLELLEELKDNEKKKSQQPFQSTKKQIHFSYSGTDDFESAREFSSPQSIIQTTMAARLQQIPKRGSLKSTLNYSDNDAAISTRPPRKLFNSISSLQETNSDSGSSSTSLTSNTNKISSLLAKYSHLKRYVE